MFISSSIFREEVFNIRADGVVVFRATSRCVQELSRIWIGCSRGPKQPYIGLFAHILKEVVSWSLNVVMTSLVPIMPSIEALWILDGGLIPVREGSEWTYSAGVSVVMATKSRTIAE